MRPAHRFAVYLVAVTLFSGCGTTSSSRNESYSPSSDSLSGSTSTRSARSDSGSGSSFPAPPPGAPPAYGVSHIRPIGFLTVFDKHHSKGCATAECTTECSEACAEGCDEKHCGSCGLFSFGSRFRPGRCCDKSDCGSECAEGCNERKHRGLFRCFKLNGCSGLFGHGKCGDECAEDCCAQDSCCDNACAEKSCCAPDSCCSDDACCDNGCGDGCCQDGCSNTRQPCLADSMGDPFANESATPAPQPEAVPAPAPPAVPDAPQPIEATPPPQASFGWPFTNISSSSTQDTYFPANDGTQRNVIEPPQWRGRGVAPAASRLSEADQAPQAVQQLPPMIIRPRLSVD